MFIFVFGFLIIASYVAYLWSLMVGMQRDSYQTNKIANDFSPEFNDLELDLLNFMPYYEIRFTN